MPPDVPEFFVPRRARASAGESLQYFPALLGVARLHYADKKAGVDQWETLALVRRLDDELPAEVWRRANHLTTAYQSWTRHLKPGGSFTPLPGELARVKSYADWTKDLKNYLYRERTLRLWSCPALKESSRPTESEREFRLRLVQASREERDQKVEAIAGQVWAEARGNPGTIATCQ